ncbi:MAG TPA: pyridoxal 5'-phosphate synthase glutaminase subunit PdxT [Acidimicrobiales bacterium]|nr:pyridoxal 5'-phosphate synthase glutaminase subunit PdxT [Acidimicrobiales bacterium]
MKVGILALQGDVREHAAVLADLDVTSRPVRTPADLALVDALILPGGESTTMSLLLESSELREPIGERLAEGMPAFGTCAGLILLAADIVDGRPDQRSFSAIDIGVRRNGYGRQVDSFETDLVVDGLTGAAVHAVFIRAPVVERAGPEVEVLASVDDRPVLCRQGPILVAAFHPELSDDDRRVHQLFVEGSW